MKQLFTSLMLLLCAVTINAQDSSTWKPGQEVSSELSWQNTKYEGDQTGWEYYNAGGNGIGWMYDETKSATGSIEMFNNAIGSETYQIVWLPAGYYRFTIQGFYRPGSAWSAGWDTNTSQNGIFFAASVTEEDGVDAEGAPVTNYVTKRESTSKLMLIVSDAYQGDDKILTDDMCGDWQRDNGFTKNGLQYWVPNSMWGACLYFDMGKYENELMFINPEDGFVKIGIRKGPEHIADDWIIFNNLRAYYVSDAGEIVQLTLAQESLRNVLAEAEAQHDMISETYGSLAAFMEDALLEADYNDATKEGCEKGEELIRGIMDEFTTHYANAQQLTELISKCESLAALSGDAAFIAALEAAKAVANDGNGDADMTLESPEDYTNAFLALEEARTNYLISNESEVTDLTSYIAYPWFCLPEYEPTWDAESGTWIPNEAALNTAADDGSLWSTKDDVNGTGNTLAKGVNVYGKEGTPGVWVQGGTAGGNLEVYWNDNLTCVKKWATPYEGYHDVKQLVSGIPNGFYKIKALGQTWTNDWADNCKLQIYIQSSTMEAFSPYLVPGGWWGKDVNQWKELETDMVQVTDGQVTVGFRDNGFAAWTGMRLYYYGETPDFTSLLAPTVDKAKANAETLAWPGDKAAVEALFAEIVSPIVSQEQYAAALEKIAEINAYVEDAANAIKQHEESTVPQFDALIAKYEGTESDIATQGFMAAFMLGDAESTDTYKDAVEAAKNLSAYQSYLDYRVAMGDLAKEAELAAVIASQDAVLTKEPATAQQLADYQKALAAPYNKALLSSLGIDKASVDNPVDITTLIVNPKYDEDQTGWDGTPLTFAFGPSTVEQPHTAEVWNVNANISQTIYSLPAGCYRVQCQAIYRDGGDAQTAYNNWDASAGEMEYWENANAKLFANERSTSVVSLASYKSEERSYDVFRDKMIEAPEGDAQGNIVWIEHFNYQFKKEVTKDNGDIEYVDMTAEDEAKTDWWWDNAIYDAFDEKTYYYPASLYGISQRFEKSPEAYINQVEVMVEEGGTLTFGIRKDKLISGDWIVMDNWKLFYLGAETPSAVESVATEAVPVAIYNAAGVQTKTTQKGVNIIKYSDNSVRKVLK